MAQGDKRRTVSLEIPERELKPLRAAARERGMSLSRYLVEAGQVLLAEERARELRELDSPPPPASRGTCFTSEIPLTSEPLGIGSGSGCSPSFLLHA